MRPNPELTREEMEFLRSFFRTDLGIHAAATKHKKLTALFTAALLLGFAGWELKEPIHGWFDAEVEVMRGHYEILAVGLPEPWVPEYSQLLRERYGIEERRVAGCVIARPLGEYVVGYNAAVMLAANWKFGRDVFEESAADARSEWRSEHPPGSRWWDF